MSNIPTILRFKGNQRLEHAVLFLSFTTLAVTGLPQKFVTAGISQAVINLLGGIETVRIIHRASAILLIAETIYHLLVVAYRLYVHRIEATMLPGIKDGRDAFQAWFYNLGMAKKWPRMGRYNFVEKAEYWALIWGMLVMTLTGFMMWKPIVIARILPGQFIPAAKAAHGGEAVLAVLAILVWHFYSVHLRHWNWSMFTGRISRNEMDHDHALEMEAMEAGSAERAVEPLLVKKRRAVFIPVAAVTTLVVVAGLTLFISRQATALTTISPVKETRQVFSPQTPTPIPPTATVSVPTRVNEEGGSEGQEITENESESGPAFTAVPGAGTGAVAWNGGVDALFAARCKMCHGQAGGLALDSYSAAMKGAKNGAVILPGKPDQSPLVLVQQGGHPGVFTPAELEAVKAWIKAGAPEK